MVNQKCKSNITGSNTRDAVEISSLLDGQISCQNVVLPKGFCLKIKLKSFVVPFIIARNVAWRQKNVKNKIKEAVTIDLAVLEKSNPHFYTIMICLGKKDWANCSQHYQEMPYQDCVERIQAKNEKILQKNIKKH
jgi:hypothetical protein